MKIRYKNNPDDVRSFMVLPLNVSAVAEVLTGDDSPFFSDLDVLLDATGEWKDLSQALKDHDLITDNYNTQLFEPANDEDRKRGYTL